VTPETVRLLLQTLRLRSTLSPIEAQSAWSRADVRGLCRLVAFEGAEVWLYRRVRTLEVQLPQNVMGALRDAAHRAEAIGLRVDAQTSSVLRLLEEARIPWALIKGQARRAATERYPYANARRVSDVDVLLPEERAGDAWELLLQNQYQPCYPGPSPWKVTHHRPVIWDENRIAIELHTTTTDAVPAPEAWRRATEGSDTVRWNGGSVAVPGATELVWQALAHAVQDGANGCRLKDFLNVAAVLAEQPPIAWGVVEERIVSGEVRDRIHGRPVSPSRIRRWLASAADLGGASLPAALVSAGRLDLDHLLLWRGMILGSRLGRSVRGRLLEEGVRVEIPMPLTPAVKGTGFARQARRRSTSLIARALYVAWRAWR
jgi:Uncharacterised nucleotidyltransferase